MSPAAEYVKHNSKDFLKFLKVRYPLYHLSNVFFRDVHYGVMHFLDLNRQTKGYSDAELVAREVISFLEEQKIFNRIDETTWLLKYPEFKLVSKKPVPAAKPAPAKPAGAAPKPASPPPAAAAPTQVAPAVATGGSPGTNPTPPAAEPKPPTAATSKDAQTS